MDLIEIRKRLKGMMVVQYCPYTHDDQLDIEGLRLNTEFVVKFALGGNKDVAIITNGSTAECYANSFEEQQEIISTVVEGSKGVPVIAGVSQAGTKETVRLAKFAERAGQTVSWLCHLTMPLQQYKAFMNTSRKWLTLSASQ